MASSDDRQAGEAGETTDWPPATLVVAGLVQRLVEQGDVVLSRVTEGFGFRSARGSKQATYSCFGMSGSIVVN